MEFNEQDQKLFSKLEPIAKNMVSDFQKSDDISRFYSPPCFQLEAERDMYIAVRAIHSCLPRGKEDRIICEFLGCDLVLHKIADDCGINTIFDFYRDYISVGESLDASALRDPEGKHFLSHP